MGGKGDDRIGQNLEGCSIVVQHYRRRNNDGLYLLFLMNYYCSRTGQGCGTKVEVRIRQ